MKIWDISRNIQDAPQYPGSEPILVERISDMNCGDVYNLSRICIDSHSGTHADAYNHFYPDKDRGIDAMDLTLYYGMCRVVSVPKKSLLTKDLLLNLWSGEERIVLRGGGEAYLAPSGAEYLVECGIKTIVTDALSIAPPDNEAQIHRILLSSGMAIVENVLLDAVPDGVYTLCAFPLKISGCDGAPVRAVLIEENKV